MKNASTVGDKTTQQANVRYVGGAKARGILTPMKAMRAKCMQCCCNQVLEIRLCTITDCALHPYRMGRRPKP